MVEANIPITTLEKAALYKFDTKTQCVEKAALLVANSPILTSEHRAICRFMIPEEGRAFDFVPVNVTKASLANVDRDTKKLLDVGGQLLIKTYNLPYYW